MNTQNWLKKRVIGLSASESGDLLNLGFGSDHLRESLVRLARPMLRAGASLAFGGHFKERSLTRTLIDLISEEQREGTADQRPWIGILYNHSPWPHYKTVSDEDEARYIEVCRFIRITQELAGLPDVIEDESQAAADRLAFNQAVVLTAMRKFMAHGMELEHIGTKPDTVPPIAARVLIGGKTSGFTGVLPGLYEETLFCLEKEITLFILGGYGGASAMLSGFIRGDLDEKAALLELTALYEGTPELERLEECFSVFAPSESARAPSAELSELVSRLSAPGTDMADILNNKLTDEENLRLFDTVDTAEAAKLVMQGLKEIFASSTEDANETDTENG